jgi:tRNA threonylcarbamoyladenosine biosynthesis protein TsaB
MLKSVHDCGDIRMLMIDTCGEGAGLALSEGRSALASCALPPRTASAEIVSAVRKLLMEAHCSLQELRGVGVVAGPGSFTGVRTGLAAAKGICEAVGLPLATVSRLEVLERAAGVSDGISVLGAGRHDLYVRTRRGDSVVEAMTTVERLCLEAAGADVAVAEATTANALQLLHPRLIPLTVLDAVPCLVEALLRGGVDLASADANYVRRESELYAPQAGRSSPS